MKKDLTPQEIQELARQNTMELLNPAPDPRSLFIHELDGIQPKMPDKVVFKCSHSDLLFIHQAIQDSMMFPLIPDEVPNLMHLLELLAEQEKSCWENKVIELPVNYFSGMFHILAHGRKLGVYDGELASQGINANNRKRDTLTAIHKEIAISMDAYHAVKKKEAAESAPKLLEHPRPLELLSSTPARFALLSGGDGSTSPTEPSDGEGTAQ